MDKSYEDVCHDGYSVEVRIDRRSAGFNLKCQTEKLVKFIEAKQYRKELPITA